MSQNYFVALFLALTATTAFADFPAKLLDKFPATQGAKIEKAWPGFYSVVKGTEIVFVSEDLTIMINGDVIDLNKQTSITAELRRLNKPRLDTTKLNPQDAIKFGQGKNKLIVFSDPDCPFCQRLEADLVRLPDTQVLVYPFPLTNLHPQARVVAESIWCSPDKQTAWRSYLLGNLRPKLATCDNPISRNLILGEEMQIQATPTLIFEDGTVVPGAIAFEKILEQIELSKSASK